jgi:hypothetical protein
VALFLDADGRRQHLCGVWDSGGLRAALARLAADPGRAPAAPALTGAAMRALLRDVRVVAVSWAAPGPPPWFDCDTDADLRRAEEWVT